jgi:hypothetical protein
MRFDAAQPYARYSYSLDGVASLTFEPSRGTAAEALNITIPLSSLKPGDHKFQVSGWDGQSEKPLGECMLHVSPVQ